MVYDRTHRNVNIEDDLRTFQELVAVGNSLDLNIQLELDVPSLHDDGKLPILDLKVWIEDNQIRHIFYKKEWLLLSSSSRGLHSPTGRRGTPCSKRV